MILRPRPWAVEFLADGRTVLGSTVINLGKHVLRSGPPTTSPVPPGRRRQREHGGAVAVSLGWKGHHGAGSMRRYRPTAARAWCCGHCSSCSASLGVRLGQTNHACRDVVVSVRAGVTAAGDCARPGPGLSRDVLECIVSPPGGKHSMGLEAIQQSSRPRRASCISPAENSSVMESHKGRYDE